MLVFMEAVMRPFLLKSVVLLILMNRLLKRCVRRGRNVITCFDPHGACGFRALKEGLKPGETGVFPETAHPAKFLDTVEGIIGESVEMPAKLKAFMQGEKQSLSMTKEFADFKSYLLSL